MPPRSNSNTPSKGSRSASQNPKSSPLSFSSAPLFAGGVPTLSSAALANSVKRTRSIPLHVLQQKLSQSSASAPQRRDSPAVPRAATGRSTNVPRNRSRRSTRNSSSQREETLFVDDSSSSEDAPLVPRNRNLREVTRKSLFVDSSSSSDNEAPLSPNPRPRQEATRPFSSSSQNQATSSARNSTSRPQEIIVIDDSSSSDHTSLVQIRNPQRDAIISSSWIPKTQREEKESSVNVSQFRGMSSAPYRHFRSKEQSLSKVPPFSSAPRQNASLPVHAPMSLFAESVSVRPSSLAEFFLIKSPTPEPLSPPLHPTKYAYPVPEPVQLPSPISAYPTTEPKTARVTSEYAYPGSSFSRYAYPGTEPAPPAHRLHLPCCKDAIILIDDTPIVFALIPHYHVALISALLSELKILGSSPSKYTRIRPAFINLEKIGNYVIEMTTRVANPRQFPDPKLCDEKPYRWFVCADLKKIKEDGEDTSEEGTENIHDVRKMVAGSYYPSATYQRNWVELKHSDVPEIFYGKQHNKENGDGPIEYEGLASQSESLTYRCTTNSHGNASWTFRVMQRGRKLSGMVVVDGIKERIGYAREKEEKDVMMKKQPREEEKLNIPLANLYLGLTTGRKRKRVNYLAGAVADDDDEEEVLFNDVRDGGVQFGHVRW
jgi:hypothetical protein